MFIEDEENILNSLLSGAVLPIENAHSAINNLIMENEITKSIKQTPGVNISGGPLDSVGNTLAEYLISQNVEADEIPGQEDNDNSILNLFNRGF